MTKSSSTLSTHPESERSASMIGNSLGNRNFDLIKVLYVLTCNTRSFNLKVSVHASNLTLQMLDVFRYFGFLTYF